MSCQSCGELGETQFIGKINLMGYCWTCWDRMCAEDGNMIKAKKKRLKTSSSNMFPFPYEMETGKRASKKYKEK